MSARNLILEKRQKYSKKEKIIRIGGLIFLILLAAEFFMEILEIQNQHQKRYTNTFEKFILKE